MILAAADLIGSATGTLARFCPVIAVLALLALFSLGLARSWVWGDAEQIYSTALAGPWLSLRARAELAQVLTERGHFSNSKFGRQRATLGGCGARDRCAGSLTPSGAPGAVGFGASPILRARRPIAPDEIGDPHPATAGAAKHPTADIAHPLFLVELLNFRP